jgi:hypothetical protein
MPSLWWRHRKPVSFSLVILHVVGRGAITKISLKPFMINMYFMGKTYVFKTVITN